MNQQIKQLLTSGIRALVKTSHKSKIGHYLNTQLVNSVMEQVVELSYNGLKLKFSTPNRLCHWRANTFATKEPETLEWIDSLPENCILWDIGANVGLYSVYAALKRNCRVWAFEPSVFNLELLARNIALNNLSDRICIVPIALSDKLGASQMQLTTTDWGGALSTFGEDFGWDGKKIRKIFEYKTLGISMEQAVALLDIASPDFIKIDVDGLEHFILKGGESVLKQVKGVLIEVNDDFHAQADACNKLLTGAGLTLKEKRHSDMIADNEHGFQNSYNQIWIRA